ncbi:50S ribosomal protein L35 [Thermodesulfatator autotrophicus]|uniref:Large ribosomal subunit protein bL35 n=1 Tax=Thermodesulfatator autotrophicus TaxID=1795632 RepID=A0A177E8B4_9BACT|nr:50S ribosomal protein L35 [Thermodesulfatator autotrophicus]OAG28145.1 50S ribosomal protein L35 [Thermodesulfatator autotrophicus]
MGKVKMKTNRSAAKRFKVTGKGKVLHFKAGKSHLLRKKTRKRKRHLKKPTILSPANLSAVKRLIPYKF